MVNLRKVAMGLAVMAAGVFAACAVNASRRTGEALPPFLPPAPAKGPALCRGNFLKPEQGKAALEFTLSQYTTKEAWDAHKTRLKGYIQRGVGLDPWPKKTPLNPIFRGKVRKYDGYTVENVAFEVIPGYWACGNLYRPLNPKSEKLPAIINTHGHSKDQVNGGRFDENVQHRCATLARMGAIALSMEMFAYGDSLQQVPAEAHTKSDMAMPMQLWDNIRAIDFLETLPDVDPKKIAVTGESGGATQTFLLTALDDRICMNVPVVMVSSYFFGGCQCESGRPVHRDAEHFCTNAEIASLCAPRPMMVVSDGADWTQHVPEIEYPFLQKVWAIEGVPGLVENVHLPNEKHNYGPAKRIVMYRFFAKEFGLDIKGAVNEKDELDESHVTLEKPEQLRVWTVATPLPANALHGVDAIKRELTELQK